MSLTIGDALTRRKGLITHHALYVGHCANTGVPIAAENQIYKGVQLISLSQFISEANVSNVQELQVKYSNFNLYQQNLVLQRVKERLGKKYHAISYNCEHFVNDVLSGNVRSRQVENGAMIAFGAVLVLSALKND